jgi:hypothetical protein
MHTQPWLKSVCVSVSRAPAVTRWHSSITDLCELTPEHLADQLPKISAADVPLFGPHGRSTIERISASVRWKQTKWGVELRCFERKKSSGLIWLTAA